MQLQLNAISYGSRGVKSILKIFKHDLKHFLPYKHSSSLMSNQSTTRHLTSDSKTMKTTLVLGASTKPERYSYIATSMLLERGHKVIPVGLRKGEIFGHPIKTIGENIEDQIHTLTLYVGPRNQPNWYEYILSKKPKRLIFNPGTDNPELAKMAKESGIEPVSACTLVLLSTNTF